MFQTKLTATVSDVLRQQVAACSQNTDEITKGYEGQGEVPIGTSCKNNGCKQVTPLTKHASFTNTNTLLLRVMKNTL